MKKIDYSFRPETYWSGPSRTFANIKGDARRRAIRDALAKGEFEDVPSELLADSLPREAWTLLGQMHPSLMGGETLPDYRRGEVEIARFSMPRSALGDVICIRARPGRNRIYYSCVDDLGGGDQYIVRPRSSRRPLDLETLVQLLEQLSTAEDDPAEFVAIWEQQLECGETPEEAVTFLEVSSCFYPDLPLWYAERAARWCAEVDAEIESGARDWSPRMRFPDCELWDM